jgi:hypothetical protein
LHNIRDKAVLKFGSEVWVLKKGVEQILGTVQIKFLRHLLEILNLIEQGTYPLGQTGCAAHCSGNGRVSTNIVTNTSREWTQGGAQAGTVV